MKDVPLFRSINDTAVSSAVSKKIRAYLNYSSVLLFIVFTVFVSSRINNYVNDTLSVSLPRPEVHEIEEVFFSKNITVERVVKKGDNLRSILIREEIPVADVEQILHLMQSGKLSSNLKVGQRITFEYENGEVDADDVTREARSLSKITININKLRDIEIIKNGEGVQVREVVIPVNKEVTKSSVVINSSLMESLRGMGLPSKSVLELVNAYSYQIDFQRQIKSGDVITVVAEKFTTEDGKFSHYGKILHASLKLSGKEYNIYRYSRDGSEDNQIFFSEDGKSIKKSLLKTPVKVIKISSPYGSRRHPILGYRKDHKGVDFAAPAGTPIFAAGHGVITDIGNRSGYGNFIQIKHNSSLSTAYAHASRFAKGLRVGSVVKQGQVIAYVGSTGRATGPHLHFETKINGRHVDPISIKTTSGVELVGADLAKFKKFKATIMNLEANSGDRRPLGEYKKENGVSVA